MSYKKITVSFLLLLIVCFNVQAQNGNYELRNVIPPSATAASIGKYGEIPVSLYTGIPNISVPLYEIKDGPLSVPISLSYHAGGIRVEEIASSVGLGWTLNAGGIVGRQQRGRMDEYGWKISDPTQRIDYILQNGTQLQKQTMFLDIENGARDGEADIYSYNFNGESGKFFFDQAGNFYNYPAKNVSITPIVEGWQITTEDGTFYEFNKYERVTSIRGAADVESITAWYLTKIKSSDGKREITFTYEYVTYGTYSIVGETKYVDLPGSAGGCFTPSTTVGSNSYETQRLTRIDFSNGYVKFNYSSTERQDLLGEKSLNQIEVYTKANSLIKKYDLAYSYFGAGSPDETDKRLKLTSVTEKSALSQKPPHVFTYDESIPMPNRNSSSRDHWGYYNGAGNNTLIPTFNFVVNGVTQTFIGGADRSANPATMQAGILKKIQYPTGGETEFTYETNTTVDNRLPDVGGVRYAGGLRIKQMEDKPGNGGQPVIKKFRYDVAGTLVNFPNYGYQLQADRHDQGPTCDPGIFTYCNVLVMQSYSNYPLATTQGGTVGYSSVTEDLGDNGEIQHYYLVSGTNDMPFPFPPIEMHAWRQGSEYSRKFYAKKTAQLVLAKQIDYSYAEIDKGTVNSYKVGRNYIRIGSCVWANESLPLYAQYIVSTQFYALEKTTERLYDQNDPTKYVVNTTDYTYDLNHFQLTQIRTSTSSSDATIKDELVVNKKYPQDYSITGYPSNPEAMGIKKLQDLHIVNVPLEEYSYRQKRNISTNAVSDQRVVSGTITTFHSYAPYPAEVFRLETNATIPLSTYGSGSGISSNAFIKNTNSTVANAYKSVVAFNSYDNYGNLTMQQKANDVYTSYLWGYGNNYPVAQVVGSLHSTVSGFVNQAILDNPASDILMRDELNKVRTGLSSTKALVSTYTYKPLVGNTSVTDPNNRTNYYYYDAFGRLILMKDQDGKIGKQICYNYWGQTNNCTLVGNDQKNQIFTTACPPDQPGTQITYTVPDDTYYASTQTEADAMAQSDVNTYGQAYANQTGTCSVPQTTVYIANSTDNTYYLSFYNTATSQYYYQTINPWTSPTWTIPQGTYNVTVTSSSGSYDTYFNVINYMYYGTSAYFQNVTVSGSTNFINFGD